MFVYAKLFAQASPAAAALGTAGELVERRPFLERVDDVAPLDLAALRGLHSSPAVMLRERLHCGSDVIDAASEGAAECAGSNQRDLVSGVLSTADWEIDVFQAIPEGAQDIAFADAALPRECGPGINLAAADFGTAGELVERRTFLERVDDVAPLSLAALRGLHSSPAVMLHEKQRESMRHVGDASKQWRPRVPF